MLDFVNFVAERARQAGKRLRVWSDGIEGGSAVTFDPNAAVEWWENRSSPAPEELMSAGRLVQNAGWWPLYYVTGGPLMGLRATEEEMYEDWDAHVFEGPWSTRWVNGDPGGARFEVPKDAGRQLGAQLNVWNGRPGQHFAGGDRGRDRATPSDPRPEDVGVAPTNRRLRGVQAAHASPLSRSIASSSSMSSRSCGRPAARFIALR